MFHFASLLLHLLEEATGQGVFVSTQTLARVRVQVAKFRVPKPGVPRDLGPAGVRMMTPAAAFEGLRQPLRTVLSQIHGLPPLPRRTFDEAFDRALALLAEVDDETSLDKMPAAVRRALGTLDPHPPASTPTPNAGSTHGDDVA
jgi:hypothetical protein